MTNAFVKLRDPRKETELSDFIKEIFGQDTERFGTTEAAYILSGVSDEMLDKLKREYACSVYAERAVPQSTVRSWRDADVRDVADVWNTGYREFERVTRDLYNRRRVAGQGR